jgi:hypothetical protein
MVAQTYFEGRANLQGDMSKELKRKEEFTSSHLKFDPILDIQVKMKSFKSL